ncbi:MAG: sirohydrochlorin chelatase, partial [Actinomycetota bacterium]
MPVAYFDSSRSPALHGKGVIMEFASQNLPTSDRELMISTQGFSAIAGEQAQKLDLNQFSFSPLPLNRPLLMVGHGTRDAEGRQSLLDFAAAYQALDRSRPVVPCFLELTGPTMQEGIDSCVEKGYLELSVLPILLFAARHNKYDITNELDRAKLRHPQLKFHYGRHFGITPSILDLWR